MQSDKASVEISSRYAGKVLKVHYGQNEVAKVGSALVDIETDDVESEPSAGSVDTPKSVPESEPVAKSFGKPHYISSWETPAVRRLLNEFGLHVDSITGSGKNGRVLKGDVLSNIKTNSLKRKGSMKKESSFTPYRERLIHLTK